MHELLTPLEAFHATLRDFGLDPTREDDKLFFMAEIWPDEGLDILLEIFPRGGTNLTTTYLMLFTSQTASTVITSAQTVDNLTEVSGGSYARQSVANTDWAAIAAGTGGRKTTAAQKTFPTATANWGTINGSALANQLSATGDKAVFVSNFDDLTAVTINTNDQIKVTPTLQANN